MDRFKNILVATCPGHLDPLTLRAAVKLADVNNARLTVVDVVAPLPARRRKMNVEGRVIDIEAELLHDREERLRYLLENTQAGPSVDVVETVGEPFIEVIRQVLDQGHDLVMVGEPVAERPDEPHLSSGVMHLLRKCPVPVWVMRSGQPRTRRVLALVDPGPDNAVRDGLNDLIMELATSLADRKGWELHIGHAWILAGEATFRSSPYVGLPGEMVDVMVRDNEAIRLGQLDMLAIRHETESERSIHMVAGPPGVVLPRLADRLDVDLVVMGTVGRSGLRGLIMGNTAETILRSVRCSVLAVKHEGFVAPVTSQGGRTEDRIMSTDSPAEDLAPSTVDRLDSEEADPLGIAITGEEVRSRTAVRRATTHETLTVLGQIDSGFSPDSPTRDPQVEAQIGRVAGHYARQCDSTRISALHQDMTGGPYA